MNARRHETALWTRARVLFIAATGVAFAVRSMSFSGVIGGVEEALPTRHQMKL